MGTIEITFAINMVVLDYIIFILMLEKKVSDLLICSIEALYFSFFGFLYIVISRKMITIEEIISTLKNLTIIIATLLTIAPIMKTVNQTYADNTVYFITSGKK